MNESQMREEFRKKFVADGTPQPYPTHPKGHWLNTVNAGFVEDWIISQFQQYKASLLRQIEDMKNPFASMNMDNARINAANEWEQIRSMFIEKVKLEDIKKKII